MEKKQQTGVPPSVIMATGAIVGAAIGLLAAWLYTNNAPRITGKQGEERIAPPDPKSALKIAVSLLGVLRMIAGGQGR